MSQRISNEHHLLRQKHKDPLRSTKVVKAIVQALEDRGLDPTDILISAGIFPSILNVHGGTITFFNEMKLVKEALKLVPETELALEAGLRVSVRFDEPWALALVTSPNLLTAIEMTSRNLHLTPFHFGAHFVQEGDSARLYTLTAYEMGELHAFFLLQNMVTAHRLISATLGETFPLYSTAFSFEKPDNIEPIAKTFGENLQFGVTHPYLEFPAKLLERPPVLSNPTLNRTYQAACEQLFMTMGDAGRLAAQVRYFIISKPGVFPSAQKVASAFAMSERSFQRKLSEEGTSFRKILLETKIAVASMLLTKTQLTITDVAIRAGYSEVSNFTAAFKKATGLTPAQFKRKNTGE